MKEVKRKSFGLYDILFYIPVFALCCLTAYLVYEDGFSFVFFAAGLLIAYIFTSFFHELGHIVVGAITGFKTVKLSFSVFTFDFTAKRVLTIKLTPYAGKTDMIPTREGNFAKRYAACLYGGILGGLIFTLLLTSLYFSTNGNIRGLFAFFPLSAASFLLNALPVVFTGDGHTLCLLKDERNTKNAEKYFGISYNLYKGESFSEMDGELFEECSSGLFAPEISVARLMRAEEIGDEEEIRKIISEAENDGSAIYFAKEIFCSLCLIGDREKASSYREFSLVNGDDADEMRTLVLNAFLNNDEDYLSVSLKTAYALADDCYLKGERKFNRNILDRIKID